MRNTNGILGFKLFVAMVCFSVSFVFSQTTSIEYLIVAGGGGASGG